MMNISLVLYNTDYKEIEQLLKELVAFDLTNKFFIIDNSPYRNDIYSGIDSKITYQYVGRNIGFGRAHNLALLESISNEVEYHLILNPDISFDPNIMYELFDFMDNNQDCGLITPKIYYKNGEIQKLCKKIPNPIELFGKRFPLKKVSDYYSSKIEITNFKYDSILNVPYLSGCFMLCRTSAIEECGLGFDKRYFMYMEDLDLTRTIHERYKTIFYHKVSIIHGYRSESKTKFKLLIALIVSAVKYFNKWGWIFDPKRRKYNNALKLELEKLTSQ